MYSFYYVATGLRNADFVFSFSFWEEKGLCIELVPAPPNHVKCG